MGHRKSGWKFVPVLVPCFLLWVHGAEAEVGSVVVVPNDLIDIEGDFNNTIPWSDEGPVRYQQVYDGLEVGSIPELKQLRFRQDDFYGSPFSGTIPDVTIVLSSTAATPDGLSLTFSDNPGADALTVYSGPLLLTSGLSATVPRPFDIVLQLQNAFAFDGSAGANLLIDVTIAAGPELSSFDAEWIEGDAVSRVFCWTEEQCLTGDEAMIADSVGLVTMFLDARIFLDNFESGDLTQWTAVVP